MKTKQNKKVTKKTLIGKINCTPKWVDVAPILIASIASGEAEAAKAEIMHMAAVADLYLDIKKAVTG